MYYIMPLLNNNLNFRSSIIEYIKTINWNNPFGLTLTLKQYFDSQKLDMITASLNLKQFTNRLNRLLFGASARRYGKGVKLFPVIESSADKRIHIHAIIDCPDHINDTDFSNKIDEAWSKTNWGYRHTHIQPIRDDGWASYITKFSQKTEYDLAIDWNNVKNT